MGCYIIYRHIIGQYYSAHEEVYHQEDKVQFNAPFQDLYLGAEAWACGCLLPQYSATFIRKEKV
jgi:hypothetical protein